MTLRASRARIKTLANRITSLDLAANTTTNIISGTSTASTLATTIAHQKRFKYHSALTKITQSMTSPQKTRPLPKRTTRHALKQSHQPLSPQIIMSSRHCSTCNAIETAEHSLKTCPACKRVAYCNKACQKLHWIVHKPVCLTAVEHDRDSDEESDVDEAEDENDDDANDNPNDSGAANPNTTDLVGTSIEYFTLPTPAHPDGHKISIPLTKTMIVFLASLPAEQQKTAEEQLIHGHKLGFETQDVFCQILLVNKKGLSAIEQRAKKLDEYESAVQVLAGRYYAAAPQVVDFTMREDSRFPPLNKEGDWLMLDDKGDFQSVPADRAHVLQLEGEEEKKKNGEQEVVFFDMDTVANMKYLRDGEKKAYKEMVAQNVFAERYPGKTMVEVVADKKKRRADAKAAEEEAAAAAKQQLLENNLASVDLSQQ